MAKFNIEAFKRNLIENNDVFFLPDGTKIHQFEASRGGYIEDNPPPKSAYTYRKLYNPQGYVLTTTQKFYSFFTGVSKYYDGYGNLIKEEINDSDQYFSFSVEDLAAKMLTDYKIDILNSDNIYRLARGTTIFDPLFSFYAVDCYDLASPQPQQAVISFLIDGNTGETLHILHTNTKEPASVLNAYLEKVAPTK